MADALTDDELLDEAVKLWFGPRCPDRDPECSTCRAWARLDALRSLSTAARQLLESPEAVERMAHGVLGAILSRYDDILVRETGEAVRAALRAIDGEEGR